MKYLFNKAVKQYLKYRYRRILEMRKNGPNLQADVLSTLLERAQWTETGIKYDFRNIRTRIEYREVVPLTRYELISSDIERMMNGECNILCPGAVSMYAKSSGTTNSVSKYIPMPKSIHYGNHVAASWDTMSIVYHEDSDCRIFEKKSTIMGGAITKMGKSYVGDVSAILLDKMHWAGRPFFTPDFETTLLSDWEEKIEKMALICKDDPVVMLGGVPTWTLLLCRIILEKTDKSNMLEVWPNIRYYMHGGVGFEPYRAQFEELFPSSTFKYYEVYNASEGYFAVQDSVNSEGMLLLLNNEIYYEFVSLSELSKSSPNTLLLEDVEADKNYAIVVTSSSGLWRYLIGDTIKFTSMNPYRIKVTGRTQQFINVFGEEVMVSNTDKALAMTLDKMSINVNEYSVAPVFITLKQRGRHHWVIEFTDEPKDVELFARTLDNNLRKVNSDYDAKRALIDTLLVSTVPTGTFYKWMKKRGKYGGQNKVPRLSNTSEYIDQILEIGGNGIDI